MTFVAVDSTTGQSVLLKLPDPNQLADAATFGRFRRELAIGRRLNHPAVPRLIAAREEGRQAYLAQEFVAGESLSERPERGPLPAAASVAIAVFGSALACMNTGVRVTYAMGRDS